tara:strand:- start:1278 stop:2354 length:1077 start_codon:yes stop_codon:yes gene_type:complete
VNLFDFAKRQDRSFTVVKGGVSAVALKWPGQTQRGLRIEPGTVFKLTGAHEFTALRVRPDLPGWLGTAVGDGKARLKVQLKPKRHPAIELCAISFKNEHDRIPIELCWPMVAESLSAFDLVFTVDGSAGLELAVGPQINLRDKVRPLAKGRGVEVGPGLNPAILPSDDIDVHYVEATHPSEWQALYKKQKTAASQIPGPVLERYRVGSAVTLEEFEPESLDFIFSNHVFEHLPNPIQVLHNWLGVLKPGGAIIGVTPNPLYSFDCRQPVTTLAEARKEQDDGGHNISRAKYERWCRWTTPEATPESLKARNYSIHVNFFSPVTFADTAEYLKRKKLVSGFAVNDVPNNKDFAFALIKR